MATSPYHLIFIKISQHLKISKRLLGILQYNAVLKPLNILLTGLIYKSVRLTLRFLSRTDANNFKAVEKTIQNLLFMFL